MDRLRMLIFKSRRLLITRGAVVIVGLGLALPVAASAHRAAVSGEKAAMIYSASGRYLGGGNFSEPRSAPLRCFVADISTVVSGSQWGAWSFSRYAIEPKHEQQCRAANGMSIEHKIGTRWYVLWQGDEGYPPTHNTREGSITLQGVPRAIARDLEAGITDF
jgi:hypothetical protein